MSLVHNNWDTDLILDMLDNRDINIILSIPVDKEVENSWYWRRDKLGTYSVKSAYLLMQEDRGDAVTAANSRFWRKLWNLKVPPNITKILWCATTNCLPTKYMLTTRRVQVNTLCPSCDAQLKTVYMCWFYVLVLYLAGRRLTIFMFMENSLLLSNGFNKSFSSRTIMKYVLYPQLLGCYGKTKMILFGINIVRRL